MAVPPDCSINSVMSNIISSSPPIKLKRNSNIHFNPKLDNGNSVLSSTSSVTNSVEGNSKILKIDGCLKLRRNNRWKKHLRLRSVKLNKMLSSIAFKQSVDTSFPSYLVDNSYVSINSQNIKSLISYVDNELKSKNEKSEEIIVISSNEDKTEADIELPKVNDKINDEVKIESNGTNEKKDEIYEMEPMFSGYQLVGDSQLLRFAQYILGIPRKIDSHGRGCLGLCVGGQRIYDLHKRVLEGIIPLANKLIVLIGTNDLLKGTSTSDMCKELHSLLTTLFKTAEKIILLTLPPVPKIAYLANHWYKLKQYNDYILSLKDVFEDKISIADISPLFYQSQLKKCHLGYFELWFDGPEGPVKRPDLIHINESGFKLISNMLLKDL